jgi:hypothetical protein
MQALKLASIKGKFLLGVFSINVVLNTLAVHTEKTARDRVGSILQGERNAMYCVFPGRSAAAIASGCRG